MFVDLGTFVNEKEVYNQKVNELKSTIINPDELEKALAEEKTKFKSNMRKYLPTAISVIKNIFKCDYSLYKIGRDVDANFNTIETNVNKTQTEIATEMNQFVQQANGMGLSAEDINKLNLSIDIIMNYVDDTAIVEDQNKAFYLNHSKVVASSLDLPVTQKVQESVVQSTVQYNPYANQPLNLNSQVAQTTEMSQNTNGTLVDPFANIYNGTVAQNNVSQPATPAVPVVPIASDTYQQPINSSEYQTQSVNMAPNTMSQNFGTFSIQSVAQSQAVPVQQPVVQPQVPVMQQPSTPTVPQVAVPAAQAVMPNVSLILNDDDVIGTEDTYVIHQVISSVLIPIMVAICSVITYYLFKMEFVNDIFSNMPEMLNKISICLVIGTLCLILSGPIIKLSKMRTVYLERFMIAPLLLSLPISWFFLKIITELEVVSSIDAAVVLILAVAIYFPFCVLLFVRAFSNSDNRKTVKAPVWSIFDKIGMFLVLYTTIIPGIYIITSIFEAEFMSGVINAIYFVENPDISQHLDLVFLVLAPIIAVLSMITRTMIQKRVGRKS